MRELGLKSPDVGRAMSLAQSGVSRAVARGERSLEEKPTLGDLVDGWISQ